MRDRGFRIFAKLKNIQEFKAQQKKYTMKRNPSSRDGLLTRHCRHRRNGGRARGLLCKPSRLSTAVGLAILLMER